MSSATIITALYDIGRGSMNGKWASRSFDKYLDYFRHTLAINAPMIVHIPSALVDYVKEHRPADYQTEVIIVEFEDLPVYKKYYKRMQATIDNMVNDTSFGAKPKHFNECPEFMTAKYEVIIFSKFEFLSDAAKRNPFKTDYFIWLDAGCYHDKPTWDQSIPWPDPYRIKILGDKFLITDWTFNIDDKSPLDNKRLYLRGNHNDICAYILGGKREIIEKVRKAIWDEVEEALNLGVINNEQHFLQLVAIQHPEYFYQWYRTRYHYQLLSTPLRDRMVPYELGRGHYIGVNYPKNTNLRLLTMASKNIDDRFFEKWITTAEKFGYTYEVLGRQMEWKNFGTKIETVYNRLKTVSEPVVAITDSTDVFLCGAADEMYEKFVKTGKDAIVGVEMNMYYPIHKHEKHLVYDYFTGIKESSQAYPNGGFIIGKTEALLEVFRLHLGYTDDQAAYFDTIYEKRYPLSMDYKAEFVGNVAHYIGHSSEKKFPFDRKLGRHRFVETGESPCVLHFAGQNWSSMRQYYADAITDGIDTMGGTSSAGIFIMFALFVLALIVLGYIILPKLLK